MIMRLWSRSLTVQFIGLLLLALAGSQAIGAAIAWSDHNEALRKQIKSEFLSRCASVAKVLETTPRAQHEDILRASATNYSRFWVTPAASDDASAWRREAFGQLSRPLPSFVSLGSPPKLATPPAGEALMAAAKVSSDVTWTDLSSAAWPLPRPARFARLDDSLGMGLSVQLSDGSWLNNAFAKPAPGGFFTNQSVATLGVLALLLCAIAAFIARGITRPMRQLAAAAEAVGRGEQSTLPETGPDDIRQTAEAFNLMQARLQRFVDDRTRMLAAIGHDLRTPITSLRLRAEFVQDDETREKMLATIDEMRAMTEAGLAFSREEAIEEETRAVDVSALVESMCDDLAELGQAAAFQDGPRVKLRCRPDALRRAVRNLVENAIRYGGSARVKVIETAKAVEIVIEDDGPGVPEDSLDKVFAPFFRLEGSRNRETGGIGLGLAIARTIVRRHGGDVTLVNTFPGLRAVVTLPAGAPSPQKARPGARRSAPIAVGDPAEQASTATQAVSRAYGLTAGVSTGSGAARDCR